MAGRNFRRGKGSGNGSDNNGPDDPKIENSVSASDGRSEDVPVPPPPRPVQSRPSGRSDLSPQQGSQLNARLYSNTAPQMSSREKARLEEIRNSAAAAPAASSPAPGMGMMAAAVPEPQTEYISPTDDEMRDLARQSIADMNDKRDPADLSWLSEADTGRFYDAIGRVEDVQKVANHLSLEETNSLSVDGQTIERDGVTYRGVDGRIVSTMGATEGTPLSNVSVFDVQAEISHRDTLMQQQEQALLPKSIHGPDRNAVFFSMGDTRIQFSESERSRNAAAEDLLALRRDLVLNGQEAIAERLHVDVQTPEERAIETTQALDAPRHAAAYRELTGEEFPSSTPMKVEDQKSIVDAYETAPAVARQPAVEPAVDRPQTTEEKQAAADKMFSEGKDLREIHAHTGTKPEGAEQTAWEKTEFVYGQPTALDRLQEMGKGGHAVSESGYTYAMSADGKELIRYDADLKEAGRKAVEDVQAYLHQKRGVEFDKQQEQKLEEAKQAAPVEEPPAATQETVQADAVEAKVVEAETAPEKQHDVLHEQQEVAQQVKTESAPEQHAKIDNELADDVSEKFEPEETNEVKAEQQAAPEAVEVEVQEQEQDTALDLEVASSEEISEAKKEVAVEVSSEADVVSKQATEKEAERSHDVAPESANLEMKAVDHEPKLDDKPEAKADPHQQTVEAAPEQSASIENEPAGEIAQKAHALDNAEQLPDAPGKATAEQFAKETSEEAAKTNEDTVSKDIAKDYSEVKSEPLEEVKSEEDAKVNADANADLRADFMQSKSAFEAKQPEKAPTQEVGISTDVQQKVADEPNADLRNDFAQSKAAHDAKQDAQPEQNVEIAEKAEASEKVSNEPNADLRADFEHSKAAYEEKQAQPEPEPVVQEEQEEERSCSLEFA